MKKLVNGNLNDVIKKKKTHWVMGHFMDPKTPFYNREFEIKWGAHKKGESKNKAVENNNSKTLCILIDGKVLMKFPEKEIVLSKKGDYVFWGKGIPHTWSVLEDCTTISIRWPSVPSDQKISK